MSTEYGTPFEAITPWKMESLIRTANVYKKLHPKLPDPMRIDAVSVWWKDGEPVIEVMKNISA
jgi:Holliday junction resolvase-like predicted endonuclease